MILRQAVGLLGLPSDGVVTVVDLSGRQMVKRAVGQRDFRENGTSLIPAFFPAGVYVVKFKGLAGTVERVITAF